MNNNKKTIVVGLLGFFIGAAILYGLIKFFPAVFLKETTMLKKDVTIVDTGIAESVEKVYDSVVVVSTYKNKTKIASGTGFVFKKDGKVAYILTNNHVIEKGDDIKVTFTNEKEENVEVVGSDKFADIAVLSIDSSKIITVASIGTNDKTKVGDTVFAVGAPLDNAYSWTVTRGILSGKNRLVEVSTESNRSTDWVMSVMQTDAAINSGNSGGPLSNANGEVIGITSLKLVSSGVEGMGFAIPIETAIDYANKIIKGEDIVQPYIGVSMINVADAYYKREYFSYLSNLNLTTGVFVVDVEKDGDADKGGIKANDVIIAVDDTNINSLAYFRYKLYSHKKGDKVKIKVNRNGDIKDLTITLNHEKSIK